MVFRAEFLVSCNILGLFSHGHLVAKYNWFLGKQTIREQFVICEIAQRLFYIMSFARRYQSRYHRGQRITIVQALLTSSIIRPSSAVIYARVASYSRQGSDVTTRIPTTRQASSI
jgi:hypothetical protein